MRKKIIELKIAYICHCMRHNLRAMEWMAADKRKLERHIDEIIADNKKLQDECIAWRKKLDET